MKLFIWYQKVEYGKGLVMAVAKNVTRARQVILEKTEGNTDKMEIVKCISEKPNDIRYPIPSDISLRNLHRE